MSETQNEAPAGVADAPAATGVDPAASAATGAVTETPEALITPPVDGAPLPPQPLAEQIPEKYRVMKDGALDTEASTAKLAAAYKALETKLGTAAQGAPATPAEYAIKPAEGLAMSQEEMDAFVKDPLSQGFIAKLHAAGASNDIVNLVLNGYLQTAPDLIAANGQLSVDEARAEISKIWADPETQQANFANCARAIKGYGTANEELPGSAKRIFEKYGTDPDFIAFAAAIGGEMKEDGQVNNVGLPTGEDIESMQKSEAYWKPEHPDHAKVKARVADFYARKHGTART